MKSATYLLVGALVAVAIIAIIKKRFFEVLDYDLPTQGNALRFGIEGYEDAEASELTPDAEEDAEEEIEGYEDDEEDDEEDDGEVEHMTPAAKSKRAKKAKAKLRAAAKKLKAKKSKAAPEKFENTSRFQELKAKWDAYKAESGPALSDEERSEMLALLDMPDESAAKEETFEQFEEMPYQGTEYAMF
jgi:hypothetical protein